MSSAELNKLKPIPKSDDTLLDTPKTAEAIKKIRMSLGISQKTLSMEMEISQSYLCDLEKGTRRWSLEIFNAAKSAMERLSK